MKQVISVGWSAFVELLSEIKIYHLVIASVCHLIDHLQIAIVYC